MKNITGLPVSLPEICAPREELIRLIDRAAGRQIVYICAPGGHGKTVSTLLWLKKTGAHTAWRCFDEYDNTPALFYMVFCRSLLSVIPQDKSIESIAGAPAFRDAPVEFTIELLTKADLGKERIVLVLDDFHTINNKTILKSLPYVLKRLPENVSVFILSRGELPDTFDTLQNANKVSMIGAGELAFSTEEIMKHLASYGRFTTEREAEAIRNYSEGWIMLINSMVISGNLQMDLKKTKLSYKAFFEKNIWNNFDEDRRLFLMKSAIPDDFTVELCEILTGVENCKNYIDMLIHGNANISVSDGVCRYHDLFRNFLLEQLEKSPIDKSELYKKTALYYLSVNDYFTARRYSVKSGDLAVIAQSIRKIAEDKSMSLDEYVEISRIFHEDELPEEICERLPFLYASKVVFYYFSGNAPKFEFFIDKLKAAIPVIVREFPQLMEAAMSCIMMDYRIKYSDVAAMTRSAPPLPDRSNTQQIGSATFHMPFLHRSGRDFFQLADPAIYELVVSEINQKLLKENSECLSLATRAGLYMEQNKLSEAVQDLIQARNAINEKINPEVGFSIFIEQAEMELLRGKKDTYERYLKEAATYIEANNAHYLKRNLWAYEARLGLFDGDKKTAEQWLGNYFVSNVGFEALYKVYQNFTTARAYIVLGDHSAALCALQAIKSMADSMNRPLDAAEADVLLSIVNWSQGKKKEAINILHDRLIALQPYGFIRIVANEGKAVLPILSAITRKLDKEADKDEALYKFIKEVYVTAYEQSKRFKGITNALEPTNVKLSKQQALILELLSKGNTNAQIVELADISLNTVRYHTKILYQKLEVNNAMDAIVKAKQLGLLK